ncbi:hypothetical protein NCTGTJJY_CDS0129 [Serratia phage 92A1]|nr:hypothetical protein NCTGTJJY_CDS0129 [Serratia phage 92A1]
MIIIGSAALKGTPYEMPRQLGDVDYLCSKDFYEGFKSSYGSKVDVLKDTEFVKALKGHDDPMVYEFNIINTHSDSLIQDYVGRHLGTMIAPPGVCLALKMSHRFKKDSPFFIKTMKDIHFLRSKGVTMNGVEKQIMELRQKEVLSYKHPKLDVSKKDFFDDQMGYIYDHDTIHLTVALGNEPAYRSYMKDNSEVMTSKEKFNECPDIIKLAGVYEESCVLALERCLIPNDFTIDPARAFTMALIKVCTSITSGWFREFAWENYLKVMQMYQTLGKDDYVKRFKDKQHLLRPFK